MYDDFDLTSKEITSILECKMKLFDSDIGLLAWSVFPLKAKLIRPLKILNSFHIEFYESIEDFFIEKLLEK